MLKISKIIIVAILAAFSLVALSDEASARKRRKHRHHHRHHVSVKVDPAESSFSFSSKGAALVAEAERWIGSKNPTGFRGPWCGAFQAMVARNVGMEPPKGYLQARQWVHAGRRVSRPEVGAIAVLSRGKKGGHVGVVSGVDSDGDPIIVSGNHNRRVGVGVYPSRRVIAYVMPD